MIRFVDACWCSQSNVQARLFPDTDYQMLPDDTCYLIVEETPLWLEFLCGTEILYLDKEKDGEKYVQV